VIRSPAAALALGLLATVWTPLLTACRGGINAVCHCASDCRAGLVCEAEGEKTLSADMCFAPGVNGRCVEAEVVDTDGNDSQVVPDLPGPLMDAGARRDFQPGGSISESATGTSTGTTDGTGTGTSTGTSTGTTTGTTTGTSTGTTTGTTADTDTSTSTGTTTGTSTGTGSSSSTGSTT
jgi:hypothetical protein